MLLFLQKKIKDKYAVEADRVGYLGDQFLFVK